MQHTDAPKPRVKRSRATTRVRSKTMPDTPPNSIVTRSSAFMEPDERRALIAECAYHRARERGFDPGHELDDWLAAEAEIDQALASRQTPSQCG
jgi:hypothetical protein